MDSKPLTVTVPSSYNFLGTIPTEQAEAYNIQAIPQDDGSIVATGLKDDLKAWLKETVTDGDGPSTSSILRSSK